MKSHLWSGIVEFVLKHIFERDVLPFLKMITPNMTWITQAGESKLVEIVLQYLFERGELSDEKAFFDVIDNEIAHEIGEKTMTLAEKFRMKGKIEGKLEGKLEGKFEVAQAMLAEGSDIVFIEKMTGLLPSEITAIKEAAVVAT